MPPGYDVTATVLTGAHYCGHLARALYWTGGARAGTHRVVVTEIQPVAVISNLAKVKRYVFFAPTLVPEKSV